MTKRPFESGDFDENGSLRSSHPLSFTKWASSSRFSRLAQYTKETGTTATQAKGKRSVIFYPECFQ